MTGGWIEWNGGECPVEADTLVEVRYRDGEEECCRARDLTFIQGDWWKHDGEDAIDIVTMVDCTDHGCDVVAYRVVPPTLAPTTSKL